MKRFIAAVSLLVLATAVLAENGKPFEQLDLDRALPNIAEPSDVASFVYDGSAPYEQVMVDRALPSFPVEPAQLAASGTTRSDREIATDAEESPWANDHNFIAGS